MDAAEEIRMDAAVAAVPSELGGLSTLKDEQRTAVKAFQSEK